MTKNRLVFAIALSLVHMSADPHAKPPVIFRNPMLYSPLAILAALLYVGGVLFTRWQENCEIERRTGEKRRAADQRAVEAMGGNRLEIQSFYAVPGIIQRGETVQICYGVANAKKVTIEPPAGPVWPSYARCLDVTPAKDTTYTLTAEDGKGNVKTAALTVHVR